jgi:hypothetical protein
LDGYRRRTGRHVLGLTCFICASSKFSFDVVNMNFSCRSSEPIKMVRMLAASHRW